MPNLVTIAAAWLAATNRVADRAAQKRWRVTAALFDRVIAVQAVCMM